MFSFPGIRVGHPVCHESLTVFPLFAEPHGQVEYLLSDEALRAGAVTVQEVSEGGSVPDLLVENNGDIRVLFLEGEELVGAKQNRILNTSVLLPARSRIKIPVSCVERGRWAYQSRQLGDRYPGYYPVTDTKALAQLMSRAESEPSFYARLASWMEGLKPLIEPARERAAWAELLAEVAAPHSAVLSGKG